MTKLEQLMQAHCPNGVELKTLENCCQILDNKRKPITRSAREPGPYPYYGANGIQDSVSGYIFDGTFVLVGEDGSVMTEHGNPVVNWAEGKIWVNNHAHIITSVDGIMLRYLYHYLQTVNVKPLIHGNIPKLTGGDFKYIQIPVPPLPVQEEIVRILDKFIELEAELAQELARRKQQYAFYRDQLLNFKNHAISMLPLKQVCDMRYGKGNTIPMQSGQYPVYGCNGIVGTTSEYNSENAPIVGHIGTAGCVVWGEGKHFVTYNGTICTPKSDVVLSRYLYHALLCANLEKKVKGSQPFLSVSDICDVKIPVPSLDIQKRLVNVLDNFDSICSDLSIGLPAEIASREKQYNYYRDLLFNYAADMAGFKQSRAEQSRAEQSRAEQSRAEQSRAEQKLIAYVFGPMKCA